MDSVGWIYLTNEQGAPVGRVRYDYPLVLRERQLIVHGVRYEQQERMTIGWQYQAICLAPGIPDSDGLTQYELALFPQEPLVPTWADVWQWFDQYRMHSDVSQSKLTELKTLLQQVQALTMEVQP
jgi:hypothetical protein